MKNVRYFKLAKFMGKNGDAKALIDSISEKDFYDAYEIFKNDQGFEKFETAECYGFKVSFLGGGQLKYLAYEEE